MNGVTIQLDLSMPLLELPRIPDWDPGARTQGLHGATPECQQGLEEGTGHSTPPPTTATWPQPYFSSDFT